MNESVDFGELPQSLVDDVLERTKGIGQELLQSFEELRDKKEEWRGQLTNSGMVKHDSSLRPARSPTTCGVDGSHAVERLLATDLVVAGAVAVEGLTPPSEKRFWPEPQHFVHVATEVHNPDTGSILRAGMIGMELILAQSAPHGLVLLDGSFTSPIIYFNQGFSKAKEFADLKTVKEYLVKEIKSFLTAYHCVLASQRSDRQWVAVPKYTTHREIGRKLGWPASHDDRGLLSSVLEAGEYTIPTLLWQPTQPWHLNTSVVDDFTDVAERDEINELVAQVKQFLGNIHVLYYRPHAFMPALRLEMSRAIANNPARLSVVLQGIKDQCGTAAIMEPYPLYLADRMVKHLPRAIPAFRQITSQYLAEDYQGDIDDVFVGLHSYRTESGR
ncbi:MAG: DNA double-strand break repair nuclease NurA [Candidatus Poribacteria bacterium]|nr:DNA double-strand break repair nuclease NurA [Candidatus Poribacteria bacterium]